MAFIDDALALQSRSLYPQGRAFAMPYPSSAGTPYVTEDGSLDYTTEDGETLVTEDSLTTGGILFRLHRALAISEAKLYSDARSTYDSILPDNPNFTAQDATDWERRLKIYTHNTDLPTRILAIIRKMNYPGSTAPRQSSIYVESQLRAAGFDVHVYENIFPDGSGGWMSESPATVLGFPIGLAVYGSVHYGEVDYGGGYSDYGVSIAANHIEDYKDATFDFGSSYSSTFFIAGSTITTFASVPETRHAEFRELIFTLKPLQTIGVLFVNYV